MRVLHGPRITRLGAIVVGAIGLGGALGAVPVAFAQGHACDINTISATAPNEDFAPSGDGTVLHKGTQLIWMRCSLGQKWNGTTCAGEAKEYTWKGALQAVVGFNASGGFASKNDWRLPNIKELGSIVEIQCRLPAINVSMFPATPPWRFWSSTPDFRHPADRGLFVNFLNGYTDDAWVEDLHAVRLVRGGAGEAAFDAKVPRKGATAGH